jgi:two-component system, chemotaxis family, chemotaxis protein CheY
MKKKILVVDDEKTTRSLLRDILQTDGVEVLEAENGEAALQIFKKHKIDLLITDRSMPLMDGISLLKELRRLKNPVPAIMISAYGEESLWGEAIGLGASDYIVKPFETSAVLKMVQQHLSGGAGQ